MWREAKLLPSPRLKLSMQQDWASYSATRPLSPAFSQDIASLGPMVKTVVADTRSQMEGVWGMWHQH